MKSGKLIDYNCLILSLLVNFRKEDLGGEYPKYLERVLVF